MNLDDETLLTAYLDDELDEPQRRAVEAALRSNPELADQLREMTHVRDLVAGLSRPGTSYDVVGGVVDRILARRWPQFARNLHPRSPLFALAAAASALILIPLLLLTPAPRQRPVPRGPAVAFKTAPDRPAGSAAPVSSAPLATAKSSSPVAENDKPAETSQPPSFSKEAELADVAGPGEAELQSERERAQALRLLDDPSVRRIFVTGDTIEATASSVEELMKNTPRRTPRFGRITVSQGIVVDALHPKEAIVFILVMDERELGALRGRLERDLHLTVDDEGSAPASVVTLLADIGQISIGVGSPVSELGPPPPDVVPSIAIRTRKDETSAAVKTLNVGAPDLGLPSVPVPAELDARPAPSVLPSGGNRIGELGRNDTPPMRDLHTEKRRVRPASSNHRATVLVWVTAREAALAAPR